MFFTLLSTPLAKNIMGLLALIAIVLAIFFFGRSTGVSAGFNDGVKSQASIIAEQKATIAKLTQQINDQRTAETTKTQDVQQSTSNAVVQAAQQNTVQVVTRTKIVDHYIHDTPPAVANECGIDSNAVIAINSLLDTQAAYDNMAAIPNNDSPPVAPQAPPVSNSTTQEVPK